VVVTRQDVQPVKGAGELERCTVGSSPVLAAAMYWAPGRVRVLGRSAAERPLF
jgi:hypothetical protein